MKKYLYILTLCVLALSSCKKEVIGGTAVQSLANEWYVQVTTIDGTTGAVLDATDDSYYKISTYNTSDNQSNLMWLDDPSYIGFKSKVNVDLAGQTFSATNVDDVNNAGIKITVKTGKVITNGAIGPVSKAVTDAISYDVIYNGDASTIYRFKGYARTRFPGDDH